MRTPTLSITSQLLSSETSVWSVGGILQLSAQQTRKYSLTLVCHVKLGRRGRKTTTMQYAGTHFLLR
jgi:hypothetical protein